MHRLYANTTSSHIKDSSIDFGPGNKPPWILKDDFIRFI